MSFYQGPPVSTMMDAFGEDDALLSSVHFNGVQNYSLYSHGPPHFVSNPVEMLSDTTVTSHSLTASFAQLTSSMTGNLAWSFISANHSSKNLSSYEPPSSATFQLTVSYRPSIEKMADNGQQFHQFFQHLSHLSFSSYFFQIGASDFWALGTKFLSAVIPWTPLKEIGVSCGPGLPFTDCSKLLSSAMKMSVCEHSFQTDTQNVLPESVGGCLSGCMCEGSVYDFKVTASFQQPFVEDFEMITSGLLTSKLIPKPLNVAMSLRDDSNRTCMDISWQRPPSESRTLKYVYCVILEYFLLSLRASLRRICLIISLILYLICVVSTFCFVMRDLGLIMLHHFKTTTARHCILCFKFPEAMACHRL